MTAERARSDWFRTTAWDAAARADFENRLQRARTHNRPQYLRIKALALAGAGRRADARGLLLRLLREYPDALDAPSTMEALGDLAVAEGRLAEAVDRYRQLIEERPDLNATTGTAPISLAAAMVRLGRYREALDVLAGVDDTALTMNAAVFRYRAALAEAAAGVGDTQTAGRAARLALEVLGAPDQFWRHPGVGRALADRSLVRRLRRLARSAGLRRDATTAPLGHPGCSGGRQPR